MASFKIVRSAFLFCTVAATLSPVVHPKGLSVGVAPIQRLELEQTSDGVVVRDLFGRFEFTIPPPTDCNGNVTCPPGTKGDPLVTCCSGPGYKAVVVQCHVGQCNSAACYGTDKPSCCGEPCNQLYPPTCVGCSTTGSCH